MAGYPGATLIGAVLPLEDPPKPPKHMTPLPFDHTYVESSCGLRWGCFGRDRGGVEICRGSGDSSIANCLSDPNGEAGITYDVSGVCHQAANRILYPAGVIVRNARGFVLSAFRFGTYGKNIPHPSLSPCYGAAPHGPMSSLATQMRDAHTHYGTIGQPAGPTVGYAASLKGTPVMDSARHPDRVEELRDLIASVSDMRLDEERFSELITAREQLWTEEDALAAKLRDKLITPEKFFSLTNALSEISMMKCRDILGEDFVKIFGEAGYHPELLADPEQFAIHHQQARQTPEPMSF